MKNYNPIFKIVGLATFLFLNNQYTLLAQSLDRMVVAPTGQNLSSSAGTLSFTLGEPVVTTLNSGMEISQGFHQEWAVVTAVDNDFADQFNVGIYPNPTTGWLNISSDIAVNISLFDMSGKCVINLKKDAGKEDIDLGDLAPGLYMLCMINDGGQRFSFKVEVVR